MSYSGQRSRGYCINTKHAVNSIHILYDTESASVKGNQWDVPLGSTLPRSPSTNKYVRHFDLPHDDQVLAAPVRLGTRVRRPGSVTDSEDSISTSEPTPPPPRRPPSPRRAQVVRQRHAAREEGRRRLRQGFPDIESDDEEFLKVLYESAGLQSNSESDSDGDESDTESDGRVNLNRLEPRRRPSVVIPRQQEVPPTLPSPPPPPRDRRFISALHAPASAGQYYVVTMDWMGAEHGELDVYEGDHVHIPNFTARNEINQCAKVIYDHSTTPPTAYLDVAGPLPTLFVEHAPAWRP